MTAAALPFPFEPVARRTGDAKETAAAEEEEEEEEEEATETETAVRGDDDGKRVLRFFALVVVSDRSRSLAAFPAALARSPFQRPEAS